MLYSPISLINPTLLISQIPLKLINHDTSNVTNNFTPVKIY